MPNENEVREYECSWTLTEGYTLDLACHGAEMVLSVIEESLHGQEDTPEVVLAFAVEDIDELIETLQDARKCMVDYAEGKNMQEQEETDDEEETESDETDEEEIETKPN